MTDIYYNGFIRISTIRNKPEKLLLTLYNNKTSISVKKEIDDLKLKDLLQDMSTKLENWIDTYYAEKKF